MFSMHTMFERKTMGDVSEAFLFLATTKECYYCYRKYPHPSSLCGDIEIVEAGETQRERERREREISIYNRERRWKQRELDLILKKGFLEGFERGDHLGAKESNGDGLTRPPG